MVLLKQEKKDMNKQQFFDKLLSFINDNNTWAIKYDDFYKNRNTEVFRILKEIASKYSKNNESIMNLNDKLYSMYCTDFNCKNFFNTIDF